MKSQQNEEKLKKKLSQAVWNHKKLVQKAMPYYSTAEVHVDEYAAFYETDLCEKPVLDANQQAELLRK